ncbi:hypothetical protein EAX61_00030 [Dokdonia sinensis]|uniref:Uncharacterized protein n=1 Tax=Dokdonia sinensis TaxID=2479847 RepID=A0A3M0H2E1_9FLAO|nr:hypothetical protein [Dokdonia sinensis]RMB63816.1 hypothetical protein EAX61_00030 [Dokdonia sinensis]
MLGKFINKIILSDEIVYSGSIDELNEKIRLNNNKRVQIEWQDYHHFLFFSKWSLGTLQIRGFYRSDLGISGYATLISQEDGTSKIILRTRVRIELYLLAGFTILANLIGLITQDDTSYVTLLYIPLILIWFWLIYRFQEKILFKRLKSVLNSQ